MQEKTWWMEAASSLKCLMQPVYFATERSHLSRLSSKSAEYSLASVCCVLHLCEPNVCGGLGSVPQTDQATGFVFPAVGNSDHGCQVVEIPSVYMLFII